MQQHKKTIGILFPEKRFYPTHEVLTTRTALYPHGFSNLYVALGNVIQENKWSVRVHHHPYVLLIWMGALMMVLGGLLSTLQRYILKRKEKTDE